jgi:hypothetical protein
MNIAMLSVVVSMGVFLSGPAHACVVQEIEVPSFEYEIESEYEGFRDGKVRYKIEVEVEGFSSSTAAQCKCAIALGDIASVTPDSFEVTGALAALCVGAAGLTVRRRR